MRDKFQEAVKLATSGQFDEAKLLLEDIILDDETAKEVFVHVTGLIDKIKDDDLVTFEVVEDRRGPKAINVKMQ